MVECDDDKLIDIDFGDSEEEEEKEEEGERGEQPITTPTRSGGLSAGVSVSRDISGGTRGTVTGERGGGEDGRREEESDDEGFCILEAPTSTYVVRKTRAHVHTYIYIYTCTYSHAKPVSPLL